MTFVILDEAELEFLEAVNYYEEAAGLGARFRDEVSAGVAWILDNPRVLRLRRGNYYRFNLRVFRMRISPTLPYLIPRQATRAKRKTHTEVTKVRQGRQGF